MFGLQYRAPTTLGEFERDYAAALQIAPGTLPLAMAVKAMDDDTAEGSPYAALRMREADLEKHLSNGKDADVKDPEREKARDDARKRLEEEAKKPPQERKVPEFGTATDFPLVQALKRLKGEPVLVSKTQVIVQNKEEKKEN